ncbi:glycosyltransferase [Frigidibacter albus]|uniref:Glycosyltransferase n=1 Tax=Frigidibacter albus TaxID=1465486 RepID=A0A6L8VDG4_9RHOB|nr:glycosyltransferase family 4 protein [Frigidibacter albus]MZQ88358.1 glycosyltransferase [Frigidibacter albus]NBE29968.1 glycosyltransferase [Frigidibacter albus]GGH45869.1 hypothetical protein GCM10011341_05990 [Frigidibacter albus]
MPPLVLLWDNFGPLHLDRIAAVARRLGDRHHVIGVELCGQSDTYDWDRSEGGDFERILVYPDAQLDRLSAWKILRGVLGAMRGRGRGTVFLCHWNEPGIALAALILRLRGHRVLTMSCTKFDDRPRNLFKEMCKRLFFVPYQGGLASGERSIAYLRQMMPRGSLAGEYNTVSLDRVRAEAGYGPFAEATVEEGVPHSARDFLCVARLVPKKNLPMLLDAYALYCAAEPEPRRLRLCGSGPDEAALRAQAQALGISGHVVFEGFVQSDAVAARLAGALALILPSIEEQFGNVVPEAQAFGLPVLLSTVAGARDKLLRNGVNGFLVEPDNPEGLAWFLTLLHRDEALWQRMRSAAFRLAPLGDAASFAEGVESLITAGSSARSIK